MGWGRRLHQTVERPGPKAPQRAGALVHTPSHLEDPAGCCHLQDPDNGLCRPFGPRNLSKEFCPGWSCVALSRGKPCARER